MRRTAPKQLNISSARRTACLVLRETMNILLPRNTDEDTCMCPALQKVPMGKLLNILLFKFDLNVFELNFCECITTS